MVERNASLSPSLPPCSLEEVEEAEEEAETGGIEDEEEEEISSGAALSLA